MKRINSNYDIKRKIIPDEWKENIDDILEEQLFNANRYYAENMPNFREKVTEVSNLDSAKFLELLKSRWNWHNKFYEEILEPAVEKYINMNTNEFSLKDIQELKQIYKTMCKVDQATLIASAAIKKNLKQNIGNVTKGIRSEEEKFMLLTPPTETFFATYYIDHMKYIMELKKNNIEEANNIKKELLRKYHINDEKIFNGRMQKFYKYLDMSEEQIKQEIKTSKISNEYKVKHFYFTLEHPERKAFRDLLLFDNLDEKYIAKSLVGISGFVLRKKILQILKEEKIINNDKYIYQYNDSQIETFLNQLYDKRKQYMCKDIKLYRQHGPTCAIASSMMLMNYYGVMDKCNRLVERELYRKYKSKLIDGAHFSGIARYLQKKGINVELLHSESQYFSNNKGYIPNMEYKYILNEYKSFIENSDVKTFCNVNINPDFIHKALENGKIIMLAGNSGKELHSILVCGYNNNQFFVCDPLMKEKKLISCEELKKYMDTPIGKWCIVSEKQNEKVDRLLEACPKFQMQADEILENNIAVYIKNKSCNNIYER